LPGCFTERHGKPVPLGGARYQDPHRPPLASPQCAAPTTLLPTSSLLISALDLSREKILLVACATSLHLSGAFFRRRRALPLLRCPKQVRHGILAASPSYFFFLLYKGTCALLRPFFQRSNHLLGTLPRDATSNTVAPLPFCCCCCCAPFLEWMFPPSQMTWQAFFCFEE
jgi:hypothetical protein